MIKLFIFISISFSIVGMEDSGERKLERTYGKFKDKLLMLNQYPAILESYIEEANKLQQAHNFSEDTYKKLCVRIVPEILGAALAQKFIALRLFTPHIDQVALNLPENAETLVSHTEKVVGILRGDAFLLGHAEAKFIMAQNVCEDIKKRAGI